MVTDSFPEAVNEKQAVTMVNSYFDAPAVRL